MYKDINWDLQMQTGGGAVAGKNTMRLDKLLTMLGEGTRAGKGFCARRTRDGRRHARQRQRHAGGR